MSIRTLIEINHDCWHEIEADPEAFVEKMLEAVQAGGNWTRMNSDAASREGRAHMELWSKGGAVISARHHSGDYDGHELKLP